MHVFTSATVGPAIPAIFPATSSCLQLTANRLTVRGHNKLTKPAAINGWVLKMTTETGGSDRWVLHKAPETAVTPLTRENTKVHLICVVGCIAWAVRQMMNIVSLSGSSSPHNRLLV